MSVIDIQLDRINGTAIQWFTARTDEPRAAIVGNIVVNEELTPEQIHDLDRLPAAAAAVVVGYERLRFERPDLDEMVRGVSIEKRTVQRMVDRLLTLVYPRDDHERHRTLRYELDACEQVRDAHYDGRVPRLTPRQRRHLPPQFHHLLHATAPGPQDVQPLDRHVDRRYGDLFALILGPDLYQRTAPDHLPERELRATMYGPTFGPGLGLPD
jgi:hypothetical protein